KLPNRNYPPLLRGVKAALRRSELVACTHSLGSDRGRVSHAKHRLGERRKGLGQLASRRKIVRFRNSRLQSARIGGFDPPIRIFSPEGKALEGFCSLAGSPMQRLA